MAGKNKWSRVSILTALLDEVDTLVGDNPQFGYPSASSFVNDAVRRLLERYRERTGESEVGNYQTTIAPIRTTVDSEQTLRTLMREVVLATAGELKVKVDSKNLDKIVTAIIEKLHS